MFVFNTTFTVDDDLRPWWTDWMRTTYEPTIASVADDVVLELYAIDGTAQGGAHSYSAMWRCSSLASLGRVRTESMRLCQTLLALQGERCLSFSTLMRRLPL